MKTATKIALARLAYRLTHALRRVAGRTDQCVMVRRGLTYALDLNEGIDFSIFLLGSFEPATGAALKRETRPGDTVLDIGANVGAHTLGLAQQVGPYGRVLAFEPTGFAFAKLTRNLSLNPELQGRVTPLKMFLGASSDQPVPESIYSSWPLVSSHQLHEEHLGKAESTADTPSRAIDGVLREQGVSTVDLVKLDVDGFECSVLAGATEMMRRDKPIFVMELAPYVLAERGSSLSELLSFFAPLGYLFYDEDGKTLLPSDPGQISQIIGFGASRNVIARPTDRLRA